MISEVARAESDSPMRDTFCVEAVKGARERYEAPAIFDAEGLAFHLRGFTSVPCDHGEAIGIRSGSGRAQAGGGSRGSHTLTSRGPDTVQSLGGRAAALSA